jgi:phage tail-like protein
MRFSLLSGGDEIASFAELGTIVSGIDPSELEATTTAPTRLKKLPGKRTPPTVVLKRGMTKNIELGAWHEAALAGSSGARKSAELVMFASDGAPVARYHLVNAWPAKLEIGALKAGSSEELTETVTIVSDKIHRVAV